MNNESLDNELILTMWAPAAVKALTLSVAVSVSNINTYDRELPWTAAKAAL